MTQPIDRDSHDKSLDRLLSRLASVEPDPGFHQRTLHGIAARRVQRELRPHTWMRWPLASAIALACAFAVSFAVVHKTAASGAPAVAKAPVPLRPPVVAVLEPFPAPHRKGRVHPAAQTKALEDFPAPEAPLTAEEKLLLRVARHPAPDQVATLNPAERAKLELRDQVQFQQFFDFEPRPKKENN